MRVLVALVFAVAACGGEDDNPIFPGGNDAGPLTDGRPPGDGDPPDPDARDGGGGPDALGDNIAPLITLVRPQPGELIAATFTLEVEVVDADSIESVTATIAGINEIMMVAGSANRYSGTFDTTPLAGLVAPTIVIRARDFSGQQSELGFVITLDNEPPVASLDPPRIRVTRVQDGALQCSRDFDPVGAEAPDDGESVGQLTELRARAIDVGNTGLISSTLFIPTAGIQTVELYVFDDTTKPLVVDTNADGICDDINPNIVPASVPSLPNEAAVLALAGIVPTGTGFFTSDDFGGSNQACAAGEEIESPEPLCIGEQASTIAIRTVVDDPQIFGIPPVSGFNCLGFGFDARASNIADGFACAAVLVVDKLGNRTVSAPLRLCIDSDGNAAECLPLGQIAPAGSRPNCTGTVTGGVVNTTACTARKFVVGGPDEFELVLQ